MAKRNQILESVDRVDLTPMIDIVFLLLIYFMVTTTLIKQEADLGLQLPAPNLAMPDQLDLPDEHIVEVFPGGQILLNAQPFDDPDDHHLPQLTRILSRLKQSSELAGVKTLVTIQADNDSKHERVIDVLNACAAARIKLVSFAMED